MPPAPKHCPEQQRCNILSAAACCIEETSLLDFTMSAIAKKAGMSMGSIYKHVHTKEDVLIALAQHGYICLHKTFTAIYKTPLTVAEQLIALSLLDYAKVDPYPFSRHLEMLVSNSALLKRSSPQWQQQMSSACDGLDTVMLTHFRQAVSDGELTTTGDEDAYLQQLQLGIWAINVGHIQVLLQTHSENQASNLPKAIFPLATDNPHVLNCMRLINSFDWRHPLTEDGIERAAQTLIELGFR
jgi:AcrR family transcriptional regulator